MSRIIAVVSGKGGVGKTTLVANLGAVLALRFNKKVIIVDANITTSHLALYLGMYYYPVSLNHVLAGEVKVDDALYDYTIKGLKILPASLSVDDLKGIDLSRLKESIKKLFGKADIIFLDAAPGLGREAMAAIRAADDVLFITTPFVPPIVDIIKCHQVVKEVGAKPLGVVLNMTGEGRHELTVEEVEQLVQLPVISTIPRDKHVLRSLAARVPVIDLSPNSKASKELTKLAALLIGEEYKSGGLFSRLKNMLSREKPRKRLDLPSI